MEIPSADPWLNKVSQNCTSDWLRSASHAPKLMFMIWAGTGLVSTTYAAATRMPFNPVASLIGADDQINGRAGRDAGGAHHVERGLDLVAGGTTSGSRRLARILLRRWNDDCRKRKRDPG